jgi:dihydropyrimidinase
VSTLRIYGGRVVTPECVREGDVVVDDGLIAAVEPPSGEGDLDARGAFVLPGGVDPHSHLLSDIEPATVSALRGGTTTAFSFTAPRPGETPATAFRRARDEIVPLAAIEVDLHPSIWEPDLLTTADREELAEAGARTIKHFLGYPELGMMTSDRTLYESLQLGSELGLLTLVHCENGGAIDARVDEAIAAGRTDVRAFVWARDPELEVEAVTRTLALAHVAGAPVYLVHLSTAGSLDLVRAARDRGQRIWTEACTHHLVLDEAVYDRADAERFLVVPPLRPSHDVDALWAGVADGTIDTIGSDHAQVAYQPPFPPGDFRGLPYGFPGAELRLPLVLSEGARRGVPLERLVAALASAPARIFGLRPRKGAIAPGADADLVLWDPEPVWTVRAAALHDGLAASPFDGLQVTGAIRQVVRAGRIE